LLRRKDLKILALVVAGILSYPFSAYCQNKIFMSDAADSLLLTRVGKMVAKLMWSANAVVGRNDSLLVSVGDAYETSPDKAGRDVPLSYPVFMSPVSSDSLRFRNGSVKIYVYNDNQHYAFSDLVELLDSWTTTADPSRLYYRTADSAAYVPVSYIADKDYRYMSIAKVTAGSKLFLLARNILQGAIPRGTRLDIAQGAFVVPRATRCSIAGNVSINAPLFSFGNISCKGGPADSITIADISLLSPGSKFYRSEPTDTFSYAALGRFRISNRALFVGSSFVKNMKASDSSCVVVENSRFDSVSVADSKASFNRCWLSTTGCRGSVLRIRNSEVDSGWNTTGCDLSSSLVWLSGNLLRVGTAVNVFCGGSRDMVLVADSNIFIAAGPGAGGLSIADDYYGIARYNIFKNYETGVTVGSNARAIIYNNTFVNCRKDVRKMGRLESVSIANNVFYDVKDQDGIEPITMRDFIIEEGSRFWVGKNIWYHPNQPGTAYISRCGYDTISGDSTGINKNPLFADTASCLLQQSSCAVDSGAAVIKAFALVYTRFDTTVTMTDSIVITQFIGGGPDIGACEYGAWAGSKFNSVEPPFESDAFSFQKHGSKLVVKSLRPLGGGFDVVLFDVLGRRLVVRKTKMNEIEIPMETVAVGQYFAAARRGGSRIVQRFILR
jgi:hypothetical protein